MLVKEYLNAIHLLNASITQILKRLYPQNLIIYNKTLFTTDKKH